MKWHVLAYDKKENICYQLNQCIYSSFPSTSWIYSSAYFFVLIISILTEF